jgi:Flp pilus assembly protein TadG
MVELGLVLPIFILVLIAVIEFGYWAAVNSALHTASREAARYGSSIDDPNGPTTLPPANYVNCAEILSVAADRTGALVDLTGAITISYERNGASIGNCGSVAATAIQRWDRIVVTTTYTYTAVTPLMDIFIPPTIITTVDRRSIVK